MGDEIQGIRDDLARRCGLGGVLSGLLYIGAR